MRTRYSTKRIKAKRTRKYGFVNNNIQFLYNSLLFYNTVFYFSTSQIPYIISLRSLYEAIKIHAHCGCFLCLVLERLIKCDIEGPHGGGCQ